MIFETPAFQQALSIFQVLGKFWWLWVFLFLLPAAHALWLMYVREHYYQSQFKWVILELKVPRELRKSPKAMEQLYQTIFWLKNSPSDIKEKYYDGEITMWFSFEIVSFGGEIHIYMRIPSRHRDIIESAMYAHYQDIEISEVGDDYVNRFPRTFTELQEKGYDLFGNELALKGADAYPIRSYVDFEAIAEEEQLDPVAALMELFARVKRGDHLWLQFLIRPTIDDSWKERCKKVLVGLKESTGRTQIESETGAFPVWIERTWGETETMKAIERNISKPGFETVIRYLLIAKKGIVDANFAQRGVMAALNQYGSEAWNSFQHNYAAWTRANMWYFPYVFPGYRRTYRKRSIYRNYRLRRMYQTDATSRLFEGGLKAANQGRMILNTEELATIFHLPTHLVMTGPLIKRVESRKVGPPAELPIFEDEEEGS